MNPTAPTRPPAPAPIIFWVIWAAILVGSLVIYLVLGKTRGAGTTPPGGADMISYIGIGPLLVSFILRWMIMPNVHVAGKALVVFIIGLATAEGATTLSTFLARGSARDIVAVLGIVGVLQWMPVWAGRLSKPPPPRFRDD